jgi:class 3 adenylate cyclase/predicted ATPase
VSLYCKLAVGNEHIMKCRSCQAEVRDGQRFCEACGTTLEKNCQGCGAKAPLQARFCGMCGLAFTDESPVQVHAKASSVGSTPRTGDGERRQLTVLFADVVGATTLSGLLDPEALRTLLREYQLICVECVKRFDGNIHQYAGDGVLAYFGYPVAHDNDAERAVLAGLDIVSGVRQMATVLAARGDASIAVRIGIHTGMVVVGEMGAGDAREVHAIGETPNVAARIQGEALPDSVCISAVTLRLLSQNFETRSLGIRQLKGVAKDIELFAVDAARAATQRDAVRLAAPLIGRDKELAHLEERWALARCGQGQAVLISGEGGLGKSRLLAAFRANAGDAEPGWLNIYCSPFYQNTALHPMIDLIERNIGRISASSPADRSAALAKALESAGLTDKMSLALMACLVGLGAEHEAVLDDLAPDQRKRRTLDTLIAWLQANAQSNALVVVVEDLHWIDASTRELIGILLERVAEMPMLVVLTYRPEFVPTWALHGQISTLPLVRLTPEQSVTVAQGIAAGMSLPVDILDEVVRRTDGVPLFVEELTRAIIDAQSSTSGAALASEVPATLRDSLTARLDRLGNAKMVAQLAAVLGREFDYGILHAICDLPPAGLEQKLAALNQAEIIHQRGIPPRSHYIFKHALIQEAAYDTLLKSTRAQYHRRAADAYVQEFPEVVQSRPELVAHHFSRAQMPAQAVKYWQRAGEVAVSRSGYIEAIAHLGAALDQLALLPESAGRMTTELALRVKIGPALLAIKGMGSPESCENYQRACSIADKLGDSAERFMAMWGDWLSKTTSGRVSEAAKRSDDLVGLSQRLDHEDFVLQAHHSRWTNFHLIGDARVSRADTQIGIRMYDIERHRHHRHVYGGHDPGICACGVGANAAWLTGHADEALLLSDRAIGISEKIEHPFSESLAWMWATQAAWGARNHELARDRAESLLSVSERHNFRQWIGMSLVISGACRVHTGETEFGLKLVEEGLGKQRQFGQVSQQSYLDAIGAMVHLEVGNSARALELLAQALAVHVKTGAGFMQPETLRLHAETLFAAGQIDVQQVIARIESAVELARQQGALALEWRATSSLARLHVSTGRHDEARELLRSHFSAPAEGFESPDLGEGKQLLDAMG